MSSSLNINQMAAALGGEVVSGQIVCPGPGHRSKADRSLAVRLSTEAPEGFVVHSFANDDPLDCRDHVRKVAGLPEWIPPSRSPSVAAVPAARKRVVASYDYLDEAGRPYLRVNRMEPKGFAQQQWDGHRWISGKPRGPKIPYRLPDLLAAVHDTIFVVEGEKDADRLAAEGLVATTSSEGAGKWTPDLARWFEGKTVYVLADNDAAGEAHAALVAKSLHSTAREIRIVQLPGLPDKGDVSDWLDAGGPSAGLLDLCKTSPIFIGEGMASAVLSDDQDVLFNAWVRPFVWRDPSTLPRREWLYGRHYIRKFISATFAPGGVGKSSLVGVEGMAMASCKPLLGIRPHQRLKVAYWNGEDPMEETERRIGAAGLHYGLGAPDLENWLFVGSGRDMPLLIAEQTASGTTILAPNVERVLDTARQFELDVIIIDPFVSSHAVTENDNNAIGQVSAEWARIADRANVAVELVHHVRKAHGPEITVEDGRGAGALLAAVRSARVLNQMTKEEAERAGVERHRSYFRVDNGKANLAPPPEGSDWYQMIGVDLDNGDTFNESDHVGVVTRWSWPDPFDGVKAADLLAVQRKVDEGTWRENSQAKEWVGIAVADVLGLDLADNAAKAKVKALIARWLKESLLVRVTMKDEGRRERPVIQVGRWMEVV